MITVAVPSYNEDANIRGTVANIVAAAKVAGDIPIEIIVIDDGSTDDTARICGELEKEHAFLQVIHYSRNRGVGVGVRDALRIAKHPKFIILPGDNDVGTELIASLFASRAKADVILSYYLNRECRGRKRNTLSMLFNAIYMCTFDVFVQYITGPAVYDTAKVRALRLRSRRFSIPVEMTVKALASGCSYCEVGGYMMRGVEGSGACSFRNLVEVVWTYLCLVLEVKVTNRKAYRSEAERVRA